MTESPATPDFADVAVELWRQERPDLNFDAMATLARFARLNIVGSRLVDDVFMRFSLDRGEFDVLASLRRSGDPYALTPSRLSAILLITKAGVTKRVDRLERRGLVQRLAQPDDRRSRLISLTPAGRALVDETVAQHTVNESRLLEVLDLEEREVFDRILRKLLAVASEAAS